MRSSSLGSHSAQMQIQTSITRPVPPSKGTVEIVDDAIDRNRCIRKSYIRASVIVLYFSITLLDLTRGIIHTFFYETGLEDISGLSTGDSVTDGRLAALMIAYGGSNLESFLIRFYILYNYARYDHGGDIVRVSSITSALFYPVTAIVSSTGNIDVGDAELPGRHAILIRSILSLVTFFLTFR